VEAVTQSAAETGKPGLQPLRAETFRHRVLREELSSDQKVGDIRQNGFVDGRATARAYEQSYRRSCGQATQPE
jgi:hypothetical protein